jgi:hypothetical protein
MRRLHNNASPTSLIRNSSVDDEDNRHPMMIRNDNSNPIFPPKNRSVTDKRDPPFSATHSSQSDKHKGKHKTKKLPTAHESAQDFHSNHQSTGHSQHKESI